MTVFLLVVSIILWVFAGLSLYLSIFLNIVAGSAGWIMVLSTIELCLLGLLLFFARKRVLENRKQLNVWKAQIVQKQQKLESLKAEEKELEHRLWVKTHDEKMGGNQSW